MSPLQAGGPAGTQSARLTHDRFLSRPRSSPLVPEWTAGNSWDCVHPPDPWRAWASQLRVMLKTTHQQGGVHSCPWSTPAWADCHLGAQWVTPWWPCGLQALGSTYHTEVTPSWAFSPQPPDCGLSWQIHARSGDSSMRLSLPWESLETLSLLENLRKGSPSCLALGHGDRPLPSVSLQPLKVGPDHLALLPMKSPLRDSELWHNCHILKLIFIGLWLIYNVVFISAVPQSESVVHIHISTLF